MARTQKLMSEEHATVARRVVTEEIDGRSVIKFDGDAPHMDGVVEIDELWMTRADNPLGSMPADGESGIDAGVEVPAAAARWRIFTIPSDEIMLPLYAQYAEHGSDGGKGPGFHKTNTVDYVVVLDGDITLQVDDGEVVLHPGDCVVQRNTFHAWHNHNSTPVRLLAVMMGLSSAE
jgi:mannose-6-phosphate isomerase-like protein (cupin superfamily)